MPDLILMDVAMPEMTGLEAASQLARELPDVIVILTSAFEGEGTWRASQQSCAFAFVTKENLTQDLPRLLELGSIGKRMEQTQQELCLRTAMTLDPQTLGDARTQVSDPHRSPG